ncbi:MAG TPA: cbb3-type cytochrome oxidase assembly protein CcoS [Gammaproteobacteria bacterium]|nr:cbb3-type cytochrome oxidase assembly protein CcoS [Gammaproteobacteria bacterium]
MEVLPLIITISLALVAGIAAVFIWAVRSDQFEDLEGPAWRMLQDDDSRPPAEGPDEQSTTSPTQSRPNSAAATPRRDTGKDRSD